MDGWMNGWMDELNDKLTLFACPILCALLKACMSLCGFQSLSYITTVSAVARLIPRPPARVDSKNTNCSEPGAVDT